VIKPAASYSVDQAPRHASVSAMIAADIAEHRFGVLKAPVVQVTAADTTIPYSEPWRRM